MRGYSTNIAGMIHDHFDGSANCVQCGGECRLDDASMAFTAIFRGPDWCPLEQAADTVGDTAAILLRTIAAEAKRTGSWHVPPDLQERVKGWVAERDGGNR